MTQHPNENGSPVGHDESRRSFLKLGAAGLAATGATSFARPAAALGQGRSAVTVEGKKVLVGGVPITIRGLRLSNALMSDKATTVLVERGLDRYRGYGVNMISVYVMGSRFGDVKGYNRDASLNPVHTQRLARIIEACAARGMIVLVGCLYWGGSAAKADLDHWTQADADRAVFNTVKWLTENGYTNVFVDPDNEGMAHVAKGFDIGKMIDAGHAANPRMVMAYNFLDWPPPNADILVHFSPPTGVAANGARLVRPYVETEGAPLSYMSGVDYWGPYSRGTRTDNYVNIGIYTYKMKEAQKMRATWGIENEAGYVLASSWLQAPDAPYDSPGGSGSKDDPGVRWWLEYIRERHGA
jgi:hypothetical protein